MAGRLNGKTALITGGAGGIGSATARLFQEEGARVAIVDLDPERLAEAQDEIGGSVFLIAADISEEAEAERMVAKAVDDLGGLSILVNNAGVREYGPLAEASDESWRRIINVNLMGTAYSTKAALPALRAAEGAAVVNVSSVHATVPRRGMGQYDATKAAIISMTQTLAWEEVGNGVRANAVCPGGVLTAYHIDRYGKLGVEGQGLRDLAKAACLMGRWAELDEMAYPILWLASDEASFMTGATITVDGGKLVS